MRWLEFLKDYNVHFQYHPGKVNMVADALSCRLYSTLNCLLELPIDLCEKFRKMELKVVTPGAKLILNVMEAQPTLVEEIRVAQAMNP